MHGGRQNLDLNPMIQFGRALGKVAVRRALNGPKRPTWSLRYEAFIEMMRYHFSPTSALTLAERREALDRTGSLEVRQDRSTFKRVDLDGIPGAWIQAKHSEPKNVILYLHGGGYSVGSALSHWGLMASLAIATETKVLGVDYRLAPEHPCPAAIDDALSAYRWLLDQGEPAEEIVVAGDSAGGGLTVATMVAARDAGLPLPAGAVLLSPLVDMTFSELPTVNHGLDYLEAPQPDGSWYELMDYTGELGTTDPRVSPILADLSDLPPILVIAGEVEVLVEDSRRFVKRARENGVDVQLRVEPDEVHVFPVVADVNPRAQMALGRIAQFVEHAYLHDERDAHQR